MFLIVENYLLNVYLKIINIVATEVYIFKLMNDYEISKLKKELQRKQ